jgi:hypothetical protein
VENKISYNILNDYNVENYFIGKPYDFSHDNDLRFLPYPPEKIFRCYQNHTTNVVIVSKGDTPDMEKFKNADGLITNVKDVYLITYTADCQAIFLYDPVSRVIGNIHSGWKGTLNKIVINAIDKMCEHYKSNKNDILCFINPSILSCHFCVKQDVLKQFQLEYGHKINKFIINRDEQIFINLTGLNKQNLVEHGIKEKNIFINNTCTVCENDKYYSYRKENTSKRNGAIISLKDIEI